MDYTKELNQIERDINNKKIEQAKLEERKEQLEKERNNIIEQLKVEGIKEEQLVEIIEELEISIQEQISKCQQILK